MLDDLCAEQPEVRGLVELADLDLPTPEPT